AARGGAGHAHRLARGRDAAREQARGRRLRQHRLRRRGMIERYSRPEMARLWSDEARLQRWLEVELALVDELAARGEVPAAAAQTLRRDARADVAGMRALEAEGKHD